MSKRQLNACPECTKHFDIKIATFPADAVVWIVLDPTKCEYHTDYTGRAAQKERLLAEWSVNHPEGWASV